MKKYQFLNLRTKLIFKKLILIIIFSLFFQKTYGLDNLSFERESKNWQFLNLQEPQKNIIHSLEKNNYSVFLKNIRDNKSIEIIKYEIISRQKKLKNNFSFLKNIPSNGDKFLRLQATKTSGVLAFQKISIKKNSFYEVEFDAKIYFGRNSPIVAILNNNYNVIGFHHAAPEIYQKGWVQNKFTFKSDDDVVYFVIMNAHDLRERSHKSSIDFDNLKIKEVSKLSPNYKKTINLYEYLNTFEREHYNRLLKQIKIPILKLSFSEEKLFKRINYNIKATNHYNFNAININKSKYVKGDIDLNNEIFKARFRLKGDTAVHLYSPIKSLRIKLKKNYIFGLKNFSLNRLEGRGLVSEIFSDEILSKYDQVSAKNLYVFVLINDYPISMMLLSEQISKETLERNGQPVSNLFVENNEIKEKKKITQNKNLKNILDSELSKKKIELLFKKYLDRKNREMKKTSNADGTDKWDLEDYYFYTDMIKFNELHKFVKMTNLDNIIKWNSFNVLLGSAHQDLFHNMKILINSKTAKFEYLLDDHQGRFALPRSKFKEYKIWYDDSYKGYYLNPFLRFAFKDNEIYENRNKYLWNLISNDYQQSENVKILKKFSNQVNENYFFTPQYTYNGFNLVDQNEFNNYFDRIIDDYKSYVKNLKNDLKQTNDNLILKISKINNEKFNINIKRTIEKNSNKKDISSFALQILATDEKIQKVINKSFEKYNFRFFNKKVNKIIIPSKFYFDRYYYFNVIKNLADRKNKYYEENIIIDGLFEKDLKKIEFILSNNTTGEEIKNKLIVEKNNEKYFKEKNNQKKNVERKLNNNYFLKKYPKFSFVFQEKLQIPKTFVLKKDKIIITKGIHYVNKNIIVPKGYKIEFENGSKIDFDNVSFFSQSPIECNGTKLNPVILTSKNKKWGSLVIFDVDQKSNINHCYFEYGNSFKFLNIKFSGMVSVHNSNIEITNSNFSNASKISGDDSLNLVNSYFILKNNTFQNNFADGLDIDFSQKNSSIENCKFIKNENDGLDISQTNELILNNIYAAKNNDKGISIGEQSKATIKKSLFVENYVGIAIKDESKINIINSSINKNKLGLISYSKKKFFYKSFINLKDTKIFNNKFNFGMQNKYSSAHEKYNYKPFIRSNLSYKTSGSKYNHIVNEGSKLVNINKKKFYKLILDEKISNYKNKKTILIDSIN